MIYAGHQGFVRLALEEGAWLVPVLALGETLQLRNLISAPGMQRVTCKRLGFPVPFILAGRWGLTTLPLRNPLIYVVGQPLQPPVGWEVERRRQLVEPQGPSAAHVANGGHEKDSPPGTAAGTPPPSTSLGVAERGGGQVVGPAPEGAGSRTRQRRRRRQRQHQQQVAQADGGRADRGGGGVTDDGGGGGGGGVVAVPQQLVDEYHSRFYAALAALWRRYHGRHPVLRHAELVLEWGPVGPPEDFELRRRQAEEGPEEDLEVLPEERPEEGVNGHAVTVEAVSVLEAVAAAETAA